MLKQRILTAIVLIPALLAVLYVLPSAGVAVVLGGIVTAGAWEWAGLSGFQASSRALYTAALAAFGGALVIAVLLRPTFAPTVFLAGTLWWLVMLRELPRAGATGLYGTRAGRALAGFLVLVPAWVAVAFLHAADERRPLTLLFLIALIAIADTTAYAAGHAFGRTKLAPAISPGKTIEGLAGAVAAVVLAAILYGTIVQNQKGAALGGWIVAAVVVTLFSVLGDLTESKLKRIAGVKDSGRLLPGHGGALDRIDALTAAAPVYALLWWAFFAPPV